MKNSGIYCITNKIKNISYYGKSTKLSRRRYEHFRRLKEGRHHNMHLQSSFNKYGGENFCFKIILLCEEFELSRYEEFFIKKDDAVYNVCRESSDGTLGIKYTKEQRKKLSEINSGKNNPMYGKKHSPETKKKMSEKALLKNNMRGKEISQTERERLSQIARGENNGRARLSLQDVIWIKKNRENYTREQLAKMFVVSKSAISNICLNKSWKGKGE